MYEWKQTIKIELLDYPNVYNIIFIGWSKFEWPNSIAYVQS